MKTISITCWKRPHYLRQVLDSLRKNNCDGWKLYIGVEPGNQETIDIVKAIDWIPTVLVFNPKVLGVRKNPFNLLDKLFNDGSIINIYLEEDTIVAPDIINLAEWYLATQPEDKWLCTSLFNYTPDPTDNNTLLAGKRFCSLGLIIKVYAWRKWLRAAWNDDKLAKKKFPSSVGWDFSLHSLLLTTELKTLTPLNSRTNHIGREGGVHCTANFHDKAFGHIKPFSGETPTEYTVREDK